MAGYIQRVLSHEEQISYEARISLWSLLPQILIGIVLLPFLGLGLIFLAAAFIKYISTELAITNKRVIAKFGFIRRRTIEINLRKVESIQVDQGIMGRICGYGSLLVSGAGNPQAPIPDISNPLGFRQAFVETQEAQVA